MSERFPGLGSDPAPGEPEDVRRCARQHARVAAELDQLADALASTGESSTSWRGGAATAFRTALAPLPAQLRTAAEAFGATAARLSAWAGELEDLQAEARALERTASAALDRMRAAHARAASAPGHAAPHALLGGGLHVVDVAEAEEQLRRAMWAADEVQARWRAGGRRVAAAVRAAAEAAPPVPQSFGELVWQHRKGIAQTANVASALSLPALAVPVAGPALSAGLAGVAVTSQAALAAHADGAAADVVIGVVGLGLGGGAAAAGRLAQGAAGDAAWRAVERGLDYGGVGAWVLGTGRTVRGAPAQAPAPTPDPAPASSPAPSRPSPALRRLLVTPVTGAPSRKPG